MIHDAGGLLAAVALAYACAGLVRCRVGGRPGAAALWLAVPVVLACPFLIPSSGVGLRAASAYASGDLAFRLVDAARRWRWGDGPGAWRAYLGFLLPFPVLAALAPDHKRRLSRPVPPWPELRRVAGGTAGFGLAVAGTVALSRGVLAGSGVVPHHLALVALFVVAIESLARALWGLERLAGFDTRPIVDHAYRSRTVAEFWRRYNYRIHDWLYRHVFVPSGGRRAPARGVLVVFLASGLFHEAMFAMATSRLTGYQLLFFAVQGPAVLASGRVERLARRGGIAGRLLAHGSTILFVGGTAVLFFDGVGRVFPFVYGASGPPLP
jgi:hypothetical protein